VAVVGSAFTFAGLGKRLTGKSAGEHVDSVAPRGEVGVTDVGVGGCIGEMVFKDLEAERVYLGVEGILPPHPTGSQIEPSNA
jgi:hypothetical protein